MCRHHQLWGFVLIALGFGILIGTWLESGFVTICFSIGLAAIGCGLMRR